MKKLLSVLLMLVLTIPITIASTIPTKVDVDIVKSEMVILPKKVLKTYRGEKIHAVPQNLITDINILIIKKGISYNGDKVDAIPIVKENFINNRILNIFSYNGLKVFAIPIVKEKSIIKHITKEDLFIDLPLLVPLSIMK
jgi:hypothetical protein